MTQLRARLGFDLGRRAAEQRELRLRAKAKFPKEFRLHLTRKGLEQASAWPVAIHRARRIEARLGPSRIWDGTCGIGSELLACAWIGHTVGGADLDAATARCAAANLSRAGFAGRVLHADATRPPLLEGGADVLLLDPDRRGRTGAREGDPGRWSPSLAACLGSAARFRSACLKLPPAHPAEEVAHLGALAWVSLDGELKELTLSTGALAEGAQPREAWALRTGSEDAAHLAGEPIEVAPLPDPGSVSWIGEPDPGVTRSGLLGRLAVELGAGTLARGLAYLGAREPRDPGPLAGLVRGYRVLEACALDRKRVRAMLGAHDVGPITVKKRGHPDPSTVLEKRFAGPGSARGTLIVARLEGGHRAYLVEPVA